MREDREKEFRAAVAPYAHAVKQAEDSVLNPGSKWVVVAWGYTVAGRALAQALEERGFKVEEREATVTGVTAYCLLVSDPTESEETSTVSEAAPGLVTVERPAVRLVVRHPAHPRTVWKITETEALSLVVSLEGALRSLGPEGAAFRQRWMVGTPGEPEVVYMRTGAGEPEPTAAVKTWRRVVPIEGRPNMLTRDGGAFRVGEPGEEWAEKHKIAHGVGFKWEAIRDDGALGDDVWVSADPG